MSDIKPGQEITFHPIPGTGKEITGVVTRVLPPGEGYYPEGDVIVVSGGIPYTLPKWATEITEPQHETIASLKADAERRFAEGDRGALAHSTAHNPADPAFKLLLDDFTSTHAPGVQEVGLGLAVPCYICRDPEFAQMGLPLCRPCKACEKEGRTGHIPADDGVCDICGHVESPADYGQ